MTTKRNASMALVFLVFGSLFSEAHTTYGASSPLLPVEWSRTEDVNMSSKQMIYKSGVTDSLGQHTLNSTAVPVKGVRQSCTADCTAFTCIPVGPVAAESEGLTFEYQGDGSAFFGSVFVGHDSDLLNSFEAFFPLNSTEWRIMALRWTDFINNSLPWDKHAHLSVTDLSPLPANIRDIGFGRSKCNYKFSTPRFSFAIRNIRIITTLPNAPMPAYSKGLCHTVKRIQQRCPLNILMLGDSITDLGGRKSHGWHCAQLIQKKYSLPPCNVANGGISGQTVRFGTIALQRSLRLMPQPDLVCIMYGANDCKAATGEFNQSGFTEGVFAKNLELLIDQIRRATDGKADILLISGVPRLDQKGGKSTGAVETIIGAYKGVADRKETALCDTFPAYLKLTTAKKRAYYSDSIHQTQSGLAFIGQLLYNTIIDSVK